MNAAPARAAEGDIIHDADHYILAAQHSGKWMTEDAEIDQKLAALKEKFGTPPNIIHIMWDDTAVGEVGIPEIQKVRGFETPTMNAMAEEGINFMRMYTEPACTPSRAAVLTGRYAKRNGMYTVSFPIERSGMDAEEVTLAEVMSQAGYATAFFGKWHLGDTEPSYAHNQGFDEAFFTPYNQVPSMWTPEAESVNVITGPACTPSRAAVLTGRYAKRNGMYTVSFPIERSGMDAEEVTLAEVMSQAGYATAFFGKWHLGDTEPSYAHNQGFDEAFFTPYNQVPSMWTPEAESVNVITGLFPDMYPKDPYDIDQSWQPRGSVWTLEGTKGGKTYEWGPPPKVTNYWDIETEAQNRTMAFIEKNVQAKKPFYVAYWPILLSFLPDPRNPVKDSANKNPLQDALVRTDRFVGKLRAKLEELRISENTLIVLMADNGPFTHNGPRGMVETLYTGGKGDFTEGGVRVPAIAYWPGMIGPGEIVGDIIHETDLFTTFARIGGATEFIPRDRVIDGVDQTSLFINGDTYSRRDYVMIYQGPNLAAAVKGRFKRDWANAKEGLSGAEFYDLYTDPREQNPEMIEQFHVKSMFNQQRRRHEYWMKKYPNRPDATYGPALTGIENVREETVRVYTPPVKKEDLPFDPAEVWKERLPFSPSDM